MWPAIVERVKADPRYRRNVEYGEPRSGHPEGKVKYHLAQLEANLETLKPSLRSEGDYWKLKFLIHVHDTFKAEAKPAVAIDDPQSHASLARAFAAEFTGDADLLSMIQRHDEYFALWRQRVGTGVYAADRFQSLLAAIQDWNLFLLFIIVDGCTPGKDRAKVAWFINEVRQYKDVWVAESLIPVGTLSDPAARG